MTMKTKKTPKSRLYVEIEKSIQKEFRIRCIEYDTTMTAVIRTTILNYIKTNPAKGSPQRQGMVG